LGVDTVDGGAGDDVLVVNYSNNSTSVYPIGIDGSTFTSNGTGGFNGSYSAVRANNLTLLLYDVVYFSNIERFQIIGSRFGETITTGSGGDTINGYGGIDYISAGAGADKIILADAIRQYYDDLNGTTSGANDYANIVGYETQDIIQLAGSASLYRLNIVGSNTELYLDKPSSEPDELIGIVQGVTNLSLTSDNFIYVQPVNLSVSTATGTEVGRTVITVTATTPRPVPRDESVRLSMSGSASLADYILSGNVITIPKGSGERLILLTTIFLSSIFPSVEM
jgi:hypothetical protein